MFALGPKCHSPSPGVVVAVPSVTLPLFSACSQDVSFHGSEIETPFLDSLALGNHSTHFANYYGPWSVPLGRELARCSACSNCGD
jgi:hypothetical protein